MLKEETVTGANARRVMNGEELRQNYQKAFESCVNEHSGGDEFMKLLSSLTVRDRKTVLDKYSMLLYNHSLEKIHVDEVVDRVKEKKACCVCQTNPSALTNEIV